MVIKIDIHIEIEVPDDEPSSVVNTPEHPLDTLLRSLLLEASHGRDARKQEADPHGTFFKV